MVYIWEKRIEMAQNEPKFQSFKNNRLQMALTGIYCYINGFVQMF